MRILHICPTARIESPLAPESLQYLGHQIERLSLDQLSRADSSSLAADIVVADACLDLSLAPAIAEAVAQAGIT
ncbi:MAG: transcriptional regulator, partial [Brevibacterium aurantiacum]|nr:transcriptional regulator [Brevibacterium aurantiacum]